MDDLADLAGDADNLGDDVDRIEIGRWRRTRRAVADDAATLLCADDGERGRRGVGAALGAARNMQGDTVAGGRQMLGDLRRERAGRDQPRSAGRSPGTGDDAPARIVRLRNETE